MTIIFSLKKSFRGFFSSYNSCVTVLQLDVVIRPEDIQLVKPDDSHISGVVQSVTFKGVHYEMLIEAYDHDWLVHSTKAAEVGSTVGIKFDPYDIHIMHKMND